MTLKQATERARSWGVTLRKIDGEYRVAPKGEGADFAYFTNDLDDAIRTAATMVGVREVEF